MIVCEYVCNSVCVCMSVSLSVYLSVYLCVFVYGLADVFEYYRELAFDTYGIEPAHFIGLPSL